MNTDGAQVFKRSQKSLTPIYIMLNELPFNVRMKNILPVGLWFGKSKPNMPVYLKTYVEKMNSKLTDPGLNIKQFHSIQFYVALIQLLDHLFNVVHNLMVTSDVRGVPKKENC